MNDIIKINIVEVATEIAHNNIIDLFGDDEETIYTEVNGEFKYTEEVQEVFNEYYDTYFSILIGNALQDE